MRILGMCALVLAVAAAPARAAVGDVHEIELVRDSSFAVGAGSTGSSHDLDAIIERVIGQTEAGVELEYDLPREATKEERADVWQFPARVLKRPDGSMQLLNEPELLLRVDKWLKAANWTRKICGHLIFTWNAFRIECDPQSVIRNLQDFDLGGAPLHDGALYRDPNALQSAALVRKSAASGGATYSVELAVDPEKVREERVETDLAVAEITGKKLERADALLSHASEQISGTITIDIETDPEGTAWRRTRVRKVEIKQADGSTENRTTTEILESRLVSTS